MEKVIQRNKELEKYKKLLEIILIGLTILLAHFIIPMVMPNNSQYVVGTMINTALIFTAIKVKEWKKIIPIITLPSICAAVSGLVFNVASIYTVFMIPFIWIGNFLLVYFYKFLFINKNKSYTLSSLISISLKVAIIFIGFNLLLALNIIPGTNIVAAMLFTAMGINQLITATLGSVAAFSLLKLRENYE